VADSSCVLLLFCESFEGGAVEGVTDETMTMQMEDRLIMERLDRLEAKLKEDMRELECLKNMQVIRQWRRRNKQ